ncbi:hypothetical protein BT69DRAFT_1345549 [Atractiella rhizophila]|nr:hypothetical protein BT69DRAFT_1345549 [Atractiella rhizophila]
MFALARSSLASTSRTVPSLLRRGSTTAFSFSADINSTIGIERRVYFNGFPHIAKTYDIRALFTSEAGDVEWIRISRKDVSVRPRGAVEPVKVEKVSGLVQFKNEEAAKKALHLHGRRLMFPQGLILDGKTLSNRTIERTIMVVPARPVSELGQGRDGASFGQGETANAGDDVTATKDAVESEKKEE